MAMMKTFLARRKTRRLERRLQDAEHGQDVAMDVLLQAYRRLIDARNRLAAAQIEEMLLGGDLVDFADKVQFLLMARPGSRKHLKHEALMQVSQLDLHDVEAQVADADDRLDGLRQLGFKYGFITADGEVWR